MSAVNSAASAAKRSAGSPPWRDIAIIVAVWAALFVISATVPNLDHDEGRRSLMAQDILSRHDLLDPRILGEAYLRKPPLMPVLMAFFGWLMGGVNEWAIRIPPLLSTLGMSLVVYWLVRREVDRGSAIFGAMATMLTPLVMLKASVGITDTLTTALCFLAFAIYWRAREAGGTRFHHWLFCGLAMGLAQLAKGPIPVLYPALTILVIHGRSHGLRRLVAPFAAVAFSFVMLGLWVLPHFDPASIAVWKHELRLDAVANFQSEESSHPNYRWHFLVSAPGEALPTLLLALPAFFPLSRRRLGIPNDLGNALALYALLGTLVLLIGNAGAGRYAMPAVPALGAAAALVFQGIRAKLPRLKWPAIAVLCGVGLYVFVFNNVVAYFRLDSLKRNERAAAIIDATVAKDPGRLYVDDGPGSDWNVVFYMHTPAEILGKDEAPPSGHYWYLVGGWAQPAPSRSDIALPDQPTVEVSSHEGERLRLYRI